MPEGVWLEGVLNPSGAFRAVSPGSPSAGAPPSIVITLRRTASPQRAASRKGGSPQQQLTSGVAAFAGVGLKGSGLAAAVLRQTSDGTAPLEKRIRLTCLLHLGARKAPQGGAHDTF